MPRRNYKERCSRKIHSGPFNVARKVHNSPQSQLPALRFERSLLRAGSGNHQIGRREPLAHNGQRLDQHIETLHPREPSHCKQMRPRTRPGNRAFANHIPDPIHIDWIGQHREAFVSIPNSFARSSAIALV